MLPEPDIDWLEEDGEWKYGVDELPREDGLGAWLRDIDRDGLVGFETARKAGAALGAGSGAYISMVHKSLVPDEVSGMFPDVSMDEVPVDRAGLPGYDTVEEFVPVDVTALKDETMHHLNKEVTEWDELEGVGEVNSYSDLVEEAPNIVANAPGIIGTSFDQLAHFGTSAAVSSFLAGATDRFLGEEYDPKAVAVGGMATVPIYFTFKEGWYEGDSSVSFNLDSMDVRGDLIMDALGAAYGTYSYHKNKTATGETSPGKTGSLARKIGRFTARAEHALKSHEQTGDPFPGYEEPELLEDIDQEADEIDYLAMKHGKDEGDSKEMYEEPEMELEGETISVSGPYLPETGPAGSQEELITAGKDPGEMLEPSGDQAGPAAT